jgi:hypothetical protein
MEDPEIEKYKSFVDEIITIKDRLSKYRGGDDTALGDMCYKDTLCRFMFLKTKLLHTNKKIRDAYRKQQ